MEVLGRYLFQRLELIDAGVVDQDVEPAEGFFGFGEETADVGLIGEVGLHGDGLAAVALDLTHNAVGTVLARAVVDDDGGALGGEVQRDRGADPLGRPRDHRDLSFQFP